MSGRTTIHETEGRPAAEIAGPGISSAESFIGSDRFLVQRRLGAGAFGVVYEAFDRQEGSTVALKVLRTANADALYRFKKDFRSLADLRHPNLISFYELFTEGGVWFFSMELIDGVDFIECFTGQPADDRAEITDVRSVQTGSVPEPLTAPPSYDRVLHTVRQLARGLHAVHRHGKVHRDIKPSNVLVARSPEETEERLVLLDFGLATELQHNSDLPIYTQMIGTPAYMSPEQALALPGTPASDWYSGGVMTYQVLTGELPFRGSLAEIMAAKQFSEPPSQRQRLPEVPEDLEQLCAGLLDPDPEIGLPGEEILRRLERDAFVP